jgi:hypothetical protein
LDNKLEDFGEYLPKSEEKELAKCKLELVEVLVVGLDNGGKQNYVRHCRGVYVFGKLRDMKTFNRN